MDSNKSPFVEELDRLAQKLQLSRTQLLKQLGVRSRSLASYWAAGNRPTESQCLDVAFAERLALLNIDDEKSAVQVLKKWLQKGDRFDESRHDDAQLLQIVNKQRNQFQGESYEMWLTPLLERLSHHGREWAEWTKACVHAQRAAKYAIDEWLENPSNKEVWHLHYWVPTLSNRVFATITMDEHYEKLLSQDRIQLNLMVLSSTADSVSTGDVKGAAVDDDEFKSFVSQMSKKYPNFALYSGWRAPGFNPGDVWAFESLKSSFGLVIRVPTGLPVVLEDAMLDMDDVAERLVEVAAIPLRVGREECLQLLAMFDISARVDRGFGLQIASSNPTRVRWNRVAPKGQ